MIRVASVCVLWAAVAMVVALRGTARAVPTIYTISNYDFQASSTGIQPATLHDGQLSPDGSPIPYWYPITGAGSGVYHVWNPTAADFATAGDNGALPGTTAGSQCLFNTATTANYQVALASGNADGTGLQAVTTLSANTRYTMTVAIGSPLGATILDSQSIGFADTATQAFIMSHDDMYPNGWYNLGAGNPQSMTGFQGWGGFGDISLSINANDFIGTNRIKAGDGLLTVLNTAAGTCWTNVRLLSQNWYPRYASGNVTWDNNGTSAWSTASGGPFSSRWASGKDAVFEGNGGTVTVAETIASVNSLSFTTDCRAIPQTTPGYAWIPSYTLAGPGTISLTGDAVITVGAGTNNASNAGGGTALISCPLAGACGMYKAGAGNLVLTGASNYSGGTTVVVGTLMIGNGGTTGSIAGNVNNLANLAFNRSDTVAFGGAVSGTGSVDILGAGPGAKTVFTGTNTYVGITTIHAGSTLQLGGGGSTGSITGDVVNNGTLLFNRSSLTYSGIIYDGSTFFPSTPGGNGYSTIFGGEVAHAGALTQMGPGCLTLDNSQMLYTGTTTVSGGALRITNASAGMHALTATKMNVSGGFLVLDYSGNTGAESGLVTAVQGMLRTAYNGGSSSFQSGHDYQLYSTAASSTAGLGWVDNAATHQVTVMPALYGDANLDGVVNVADLRTVLTNYNSPNMTWSQGDFNYDGTVNFADLNKVLTNCDLTGPVNINNLPSLVLQSLEADSQAMRLLASDDITVSGTTVVPEPSVLALLAAGLLGLAAWTWRKAKRTSC